MAVGTSLAIGAGIVAATKLTQSAIQGRAAKKEMEKQDQIAKDKQAALDELEANRQEVFNPAANMANEFENLGVATKAATMQAEQADISLANTLDLLASTGASAGGATALAQAALRSKKDVSASIEQQEAQNERLKAEGELRQNQAIMQEKQRLQAAEVSGRQFVFTQQEQREMQQLDRISAQLSGAEARQAQAQADQTGIMTTAIGGITSGLSSAASEGLFG